MMKMNEIISSAVDGNLEARKYVANYYSYIADKYYDKYKEKTTKKEVEQIYLSALEKYYQEESNIGLVLHLYKHLYLELRKYDLVKFINITELLESASVGDSNARNKLIEYYSTVVYEEAKKHTYLDYEDLVQYGLIKLIETIDNYIKSYQKGKPLTTSIKRTIEIYLNKTLKKQTLNWKQPVQYKNDELETLITKLEFESIIDSLQINEKRKLVLIKYLFEGLNLEQSGEYTNLSYESVRSIVKKYKPLLEVEYKNK